MKKKISEQSELCSDMVATVDKNDTVSKGFIWFYSKMKP